LKEGLFAGTSIKAARVNRRREKGVKRRLERRDSGRPGKRRKEKAES
jgi:hypothetical protein